MKPVRGQFIPEEYLPPGFAESLDPPAQPVPARPAATAVLARDADDGLEVFLLRRNHSSGFVPGAYVFPGGRVDTADEDPALRDTAIGWPEDPPPAYWLAAVRETFEETGVLLTRRSGLAADALARWRDELLEDRATLRDVLEALDVPADLERMVEIAHWITPLVEPRRYDTRFFLAAAPEGAVAVPDAREMSDAVWIRPDRAIERFREGRLPMVFPTVHTLESLTGFATVDHAIDALRGAPVRPILPRLVRSGGGVRTVIDEENEG